MFGYRRHSFKRAVALLSALRTNRDDSSALLSLQDLLISEIFLAEDRIRINGKKPNYSRSRLKSIRKSIYHWKAFGDAIAFLYLDRFSLKHVHYNTRNYNVKQDAGFLSGSAGHDNEVKALRSLIEAGYPSVLSDLTNTIRYGDICVMIGPDPILIEVKSSNVKNPRARRQVKDIQTLHEFYSTDRSDTLRGLPGILRIENSIKLSAYDTEFNRCIDKAYGTGYALASPEDGIHYIAITKFGISVEEIIGQANVGAPWIIMLNEWKSEQKWAPFYPYTLLIEDEKALYDFILGRLFIIVLLDMEVMKEIVADMGYEPEIDPNSEYPIRARKLGAEGEMRISTPLLMRAAFEAVSLKWIIHSALAALAGLQ